MNKITFNTAGLTFRRENFDTIMETHDPLKSFDTKLEREPDNQYDANAIKVIVDGVHLGYVPATMCVALAPMMDNGTEIKCEIEEIGTFEKTQKNGKKKVLPYCRANLLMD